MKRTVLHNIKNTGIVLNNQMPIVRKFPRHAKKATKRFVYRQYFDMHPAIALSTKEISRVLTYKLTGDMKGYVWRINGQAYPHIRPEFVRKGERVKVVITNDTGMLHPMHLHGHVFQLVGIDGHKVNGFVGDTIAVLPRSKVTLIFDANNPGIWAFHCHLLWHQASGMMTTVNYAQTTPPSFYLKYIGMTPRAYSQLKNRELSKFIQP